MTGLLLRTAPESVAMGSLGELPAAKERMREVLAIARCVRLRASDIPDAGARERFLRQVPENAQTLALARQRWGELPE